MKMRIFILLILIFVFKISYSQQYEYKFQDSVDLNSDGKTDIIKLEIGKEHSYKLSINDVIYEGFIYDYVDGFTIVDINDRDKYKEIAIHTPGPSDDDVFFIHWYNGSEVIKMIDLARWPEFKGNGIVYVNSWCDFWAPRDKYKLDNATRELILVEQYGYHVGVKITIETGFKIYKEKELKNEVALLSNKSEIEIILCDKKCSEDMDMKFLIKSSSGLLGWVDYMTMVKNIILPMAD